jgi:hypothetical protein
VLAENGLERIKVADKLLTAIKQRTISCGLVLEGF